MPSGRLAEAEAETAMEPKCEAEPRDRRADLVMGAFAVVLSAAYLAVGWNLPANPFEPVGSGTIPNVIAGIGIVLGGLLLVRSVRELRAPHRSWRRAGRWSIAAAVFAWTCLYAAILAAGFVRYAIATTIFAFVVVLLIAENRRAALPWAAGLALVLGVGIDLLFRSVFTADIP